MMERGQIGVFAHGVDGNRMRGRSKYPTVGDWTWYGAEEFKAESFRVGDEGMFEGGEVRITSIEDNSGDGRQNVYFFTYLDEEGNSDGFTHTSGERRFLNQFSMYERLECRRVWG